MMTEDRDLKKRKLSDVDIEVKKPERSSFETKINESQPGLELLKCEYMIPHKNRRCGMQRKKDQKFCSQHMGIGGVEDRVACPLDPHHTISRQNLAKHLKKCNSRKKEVHDPWYSCDYNSSLQDFEIEDFYDEIAEGEDLSQPEVCKKYIKHVSELKKTFSPLHYHISSHQGMEKRLSEVEHQKHPIQQSSLAGNLKERGQLGPENFYMEFGCGKAELSRYLNLCILQDFIDDPDSKRFENYGFGLVDRGINRMKNDLKIIKETNEITKEKSIDIRVPRIKRTRMDIKDLLLSEFLYDCQYQNVVGISKHLCGVATDLTLKLIVNSDLVTSGKFKGCLIAMCCRHLCDYDQLLPQSRKFLSDRGIGATSFKILKRFVSWAVSGPGTSSSSSCNEGEANSTEQLTGLNASQRKDLGLVARRLIDESRLYAIRQILPKCYQSELFWYVETDVTLENVCLSIVKTDNEVLK